MLDREVLFWLAGTLSLLMLVASLVLIPLLIVRIPADYFRYETPPPDPWRYRHPILRLAIVIGKNVLGALLVIAGVAMLALPGQGLLTIIIGIMLLNFPGKRSLERWIIRRRGVLRAVNWLRSRAHRPPLQPPE